MNKLDIKTLLPELKKLVLGLAEDLLKRVNDNAEINEGLKNAYKQVEKGGRTSQAYEVWLEDYLDQVAVAWVLSCVFVRFMEDNHLIDECWLAGEDERRNRAENEHELYFREHPHVSDREYFEHVFHEVGKIPACRDLFAEGKTPLWAMGPSGDAAMKLLAFWREIDSDSGRLRRKFNVEDDDTRFLGDLYQDLSERARKKYALLQTPVFVEEFILDRTLDPAIDEFGLDEVRMIDPTCGSGHFLLGGFARLFDLRIKREDNEVVAAQKALDGVWGVDINPFAVAIARFRLIVVALRACGIKRLKDAPAWRIHLATGDSLLFGSRWDRDGKKKKEQQFLGTDEESWAPEIYACEDKGAISDVLGQQYHAVVGNPPYITPKDKSLNQAYRERYPDTCHRLYSLGVPFTERFFDLAVSSSASRPGFVGLINANSFMKRAFGLKLIETFLPTVDLTHVIDTSLAFIPGHTTSTVILFGRNRPPLADKVRAILGSKGEPGTPDDPAQGVVWQSIVSLVDQIGSENEYISSVEILRTTFSKHPWSIGGGGAADLKETIESQKQTTLSKTSDSIGFMCITKQDEVFSQPEHVLRKADCEEEHIRPFGVGEDVRDWKIETADWVIFPYSEGSLVKPSSIQNVLTFMWPYRTTLWDRKVFGGKTYRQAGRAWYEYGQIPFDRMRTPLSITFTEIVTHNHFALDRGGTVFKQTAPIIKLHAESTLDEHFALLGLLNSSTFCFWAKQVIPCKGLGGQGGGIKTEPWSRLFVFNGTSVGRCPIPNNVQRLASLSQSIDELTLIVSENSPSRIVGESVNDLANRLVVGRNKSEAAQRQMVALQEELDWLTYGLFGLGEYEAASQDALKEGLHPQDRPVERLLKQSIDSGTNSIFYKVHAYRGTGDRTTPPSRAMAELTQRRIEQIGRSPELQLCEKPDFKRRWQVEPWDNQQKYAIRKWLLARLEISHYWPSVETQEPKLQSVSELSDKASGDQEFSLVAAVYRGREDFDIGVLVEELVEGESVPSLPVLRYKASGLRKRSAWETTWELQRREDSGERIETIKVPPTFTGADFQKNEYYRLRGKLDVPKERWISFPHCETESDPSLVVGWAGWNHVQQATALIAYYDARKRDGWDAKRLTPLLAGLDQLLPWIHQWHPEIDPEYNETAGASFQNLLESEAQELGITIEDIRNWTPPKKKTTRRKKAKV